jgi:lysophospholipase L1-like esterase
MPTTREKHSMRDQLIAGLAAVSAAAAAVLAPCPAQADEPAPLQYVAMGDSFAAGSGIFPLAPGSAPECLQSGRNYPHVAAAALDARLTDVTCGGATTSHLRKAQWPGVAPQLDALTAETDVVTINIGGNDANAFAKPIVLCGSLGVLSGGFGSPCKDQFGTTLNAAVDDVVYPNVVGALRAVHDAAPGAQVFITGTPWVIPTSFDPTCYLKMPLARGDVPFMRAYQAHLNAAFEQAAAVTGSTFVDMSVVSDGRDACKPAGVRWVEPAFGGNNVVHPNALGEAGMAHRVLDVMAAQGIS